jgi:lipopolysaccharide export system permease protein
MILYRYILSRHFGPFLFAFFTLMFIFLLQFIMRFIDELLGKGLGFFVIAELIVLNLSWMLVLAVPMAVLVATLMAFGGMSANNEITAMRASGVSLYRMMAPVFLTSILLAVFLVYFNNDVLPDANHRAKTMMIDIRRKKPALTLSPGLFSRDITGYSILVRKTFEATNDLEGVTIYDYSDPEKHVVITAEHGVISFTPDYQKLIMDLRNGEIHELSLTQPSARPATGRGRQYRKIRYEKHRIIMNAEGFGFERSGEGTFSRGDRELSAPVMQAIVDSLNNDNMRLTAASSKIIDEHFQQYLGGSAPSMSTSRQQAIDAALNKARYYASILSNDLSRLKYNEDRMDEFLVEIHKKYALPAACIVFVLIGAPLGVMARRGGFGIAATLSLGFFVLYWACLIGGEKLADRGIITPFWGMWFANIVLTILGSYLTLRIGKESLIIHWGALKRLIPESWRTPESPENPEDYR